MNAIATKEPRAVREPQRAVERESVAPEVNIFETKDEYILEAEMPGVNKDGLEVLLEGNVLTIVGHRHDVATNGDVLYRESRDVDFRRSFELDPAIENGKISARMDQGVLRLVLPKAARAKPQRITVTD